MFLYYQVKISNSAVILLPKQCVYGDAITVGLLVIADCHLKGNEIAIPPPVPLRGRRRSGADKITVDACLKGGIT